MTTTPDLPNFRAHCAELLFAIQLYTGQNPAASEMSCVEVTEKLMNAMAATTAALDTPPPKPGKPTAWMYQGEDDFDGIRWRENWEVTIDEKLARFKLGNKEPIPLFKAHDLAPPPKPPTEEELEKVADHYMVMDGATGSMSLEHLHFARAVLERWGNQATITQTHND